MKAIIVFGILISVVAIFWQYRRKKDFKKLLLSISTLALIISLAIIGNITRTIVPIFMTHIVLVLISWGALMLYIMRGRYYWWVILSPAVTILLFLTLELLTGSRHDY